MDWLSTAQTTQWDLGGITVPCSIAPADTLLLGYVWESAAETKQLTWDLCTILTSNYQCVSQIVGVSVKLSLCQSNCQYVSQSSWHRQRVVPVQTATVKLRRRLSPWLVMAQSAAELQKCEWRNASNCLSMAFVQLVSQLGSHFYICATYLYVLLLHLWFDVMFLY